MNELTHNPQPSVEDYLHPAYWDDATIGYGQLVPYPLAKYNLAADRASAEILGAHIARGAGTLALQQYRAGDTFRAANHAHGTIVRLRSENLLHLVPLDEARVDVAAYAGKQPPERVTSLLADDIQHDGDRYTFGNFVYWGVVCHIGRRPRLLTYTASQVQMQDGAVYMPQSIPLQPTFDIGTTYHYGSGGEEVLERVHTLEVCGMGAARQKRSWNTFLAGLRRLATGAG
ncbi:MAG TPA: hypothetical protein VF466_03890 [Candidatus Saccharimonadales bacterium]